MSFQKPHLSVDEQLELLISRGLEVHDRDRALRLLRYVGYYRLAGYVYPFRISLPEGQRFISSRAHARSNAIATGISLSDVDALRLFDTDLRIMVLEALADIEIALGSVLANVIAEHDIYGHLDRGFFDAREVSRRRTGSELDEFDRWLDRYQHMAYQARHEQYAIHHMQVYGPPYPIWIAVQFMDFGSVTRLITMLRDEHQRSLAKSFGIRGGSLLSAFGKNLNYLRNMAAHNNRLWNRTLTYSVRKFKPPQVEPVLQHAATHEPRDKIYVPLAIMAYLVRQIDPTTTWPERLRHLVRDFPTANGLSPESDIGFPGGWAQFDLWN